MNMLKVIRLGDRTSHGGVVTSATSRFTVGGKNVARLGDTCTCPKKGHNNCVIVEGDPNWTIDGVPVALEGHKLSCGAVLISSMPNAGRVHDGGAAGAGVSSLNSRNSTTLFSRESSETTPAKGYDLFFHLKIAKTGASQPKTPYRITLVDGREFIGISDENGFTEKVYSDTPQTAKIEAPYYDIDASNTYTNYESDTCSC